MTPEGPLRVSINPLIQPAPHPCPIFHPGTGGEIDLTPGEVWVLRLPYPYIVDILTIIIKIGYWCESKDNFLLKKKKLP